MLDNCILMSCFRTSTVFIIKNLGTQLTDKSKIMPRAGKQDVEVEVGWRRDAVSNNEKRP